ncbi:putative 3-oxo-5-alpha-steroid 4-dehydrogenase 1 [Cocos nucifera]|nr:putative 3-oxo-5-alpha-steroid 4-dehydrogenase 1 [Cocos nucifera]
MMPTLLLNFLYPPLPSLFLAATSVISFTTLSFLGLSEVSGKHLQYSKFWNANPPPRPNPIRLSGRTGMLLLYAPALAAAVASFAVPGVVTTTSSQLLSLALSLHFFKRVFERNDRL